MAFELILVEQVEETIKDLSRRDVKKLRRVTKALAMLEADPSYPGLASHRYHVITGPTGQPIFESYVENHSPSAWRIWWYYGPETGQITVFDLGEHP